MAYFAPLRVKISRFLYRIKHILFYSYVFQNQNLFGKPPYNVKKQQNIVYITIFFCFCTFLGQDKGRDLSPAPQQPRKVKFMPDIRLLLPGNPVSVR